MKNDIFKRQNEEDVLELLYAQRVSYDRAELYNMLGWIMTVLLLVQEIFKIFIPIIENHSLIICATLAIIIYIADWKKTKYIERGAQLKGLIDCILFEFPINKNQKEDLIDYALELKSRNEEKYQQQITHNGDDEIKGVKNWYTVYNNENCNEVILNCQKQNLWWNEELVKYYKRILMTCVALFAIATIASIYFTGIKLPILFSILIMITTVFFRCWGALKNMRIYTEAKSRANGKLDIIGNHLDKSALISLQEEIDTIRGSGFLIPNWVHALYSVKLHKKRQKLNSRIDN